MAEPVGYPCRKKSLKSKSKELLAKVRNLPFDRLRVNGLRLKLFSFSVRGELVEPQKILLQEAHLLNFFKIKILKIWVSPVR
jgi:hypothetical protein